MFNNLLTSL